jgi:hypothetical protein
MTSAWLGLAVGLSIRSAGMLYTFGCLVLPALVAKNICREVRPMFVVAPAVAVGTATVGFVLANHYDDPPRPDDGRPPLPALSLHLVSPTYPAKLAPQLKTGGWGDLVEQEKLHAHGGAVSRPATSRVRRRSRYPT